MTSGQTATPTARALLVDSVRRRRHLFRGLAGWSVLEALPVFLSGLLVAKAVNSFVAKDLTAGFGWLAVFGMSVLVGAVGTRQALRRLAAVVEPFRDELVSGVVRGALQRSTVSGSSAHTSDVARLSEQTETVREAYAGVLMVVQQFLVVSLSAVVGLLTLSSVALVFVLPPLVAAVALFLVTLRLMAKQQLASITADERFAHAATTLSSGVRDVVASGGEDEVAESAGRFVDDHAAATRALGRLSAVGTLTIAIGSWLPLVLLLGFGSRLVEGGASAGVIVGAATYVMQGLQPALETLVHGLGGPGLWLMVTLRRVAGSMDVPGSQGVGRTNAADPAPGSALQVSDATFAYSDWATPVVSGLDLTIPAGDHLAIVGPSGIGKSTLAGLMTGLLEPQRGDVRLGRMRVGDLSRQALAHQRVLIPQEAYVFDGTVRDNLTYLRDGVPSDELDGVVALLGAAPLVERLGGYDATIEPTSMSAGERQVIALVRAYLSPAPFVILDEATCHLDPGAEAVVERAFRDRPGTLVVIAHRMSSALRARRILVLDGTTSALGTDDELMVSSPLYRDLVGHWQSGAFFSPTGGGGG